MKKSRIFALLLAALLVVTAICACLPAFAAVGDNLAKGKEYEGANPSTLPQNANYTANLTDGVALDKLSYEKGDWFAFYYNEAAEGDQINAPDKVGTVTIDLGAVYSVDSVKVNTFTGNSSGILPPKSMKVEYSEDNSKFSVLEEKTFTVPEVEKDDAGKNIPVETVENVEFKGSASVNAQYIRVTVELQGIFAFLNEIEVIEGAPIGGDGGNTENSTSTDSTSTDSTSTDSTSTDSTSTDSTSTDSTSTDSTSTDSTSSDSTSSDNNSTDETSGNNSSAPGGSSTSVSTEPSTSAPAASGSTSPSTGDAGLIGFAVLMVVAVSGVIIAAKVRK